MSWRGEVVALGLGVIAAAYAATAAGNAEPATGNTEPATGNRQPATGNRQSGEVAETGTEHRAPSPVLRAPSLSGTDPDGALSFSEDNSMFIPTPGAIRLFDHYLTTLGESSGTVDLATIRTLVAADARRFAPERVADVLTLFDRYTDYLADLHDALSASRNLPLSDAFAVTLSRQRAYFGDDAEILFGAENALARQLLTRASGAGASSPSR